MLDPRELSLLRWRIAAGVGCAVAFVVLGASSQGLYSDIAYCGTVMVTLLMTAWMVRWADSSSLVRRLVLAAMLLLVMAQVLDISEHFARWAHVPVLGSQSVWNGRLSSIGISMGLVLTFSALTFALVETRLGHIAHDRYGLLAENVSDVIFTADLNLACSYISPSITRLCGLTVEEALAQQPGNDSGLLRGRVSYSTVNSKTRGAGCESSERPPP